MHSTRRVTTKQKKGGMMRKLVILALLAAVMAAVAAASAAAKPPGTNGLISFTRFEPALHQDVVYTIKPDGSGERPLLSEASPGTGRRTGPGSRWVPTAAPSGSSTPTTAATPSCRPSTPTSGCSSRAVSGRPTVRGLPVRASATSRARTASTRFARPTAATCEESPREPTTTARATTRRTASASSSCVRRSTSARSRSTR